MQLVFVIQLFKTVLNKQSHIIKLLYFKRFTSNFPSLNKKVQKVSK